MVLKKRLLSELRTHLRKDRVLRTQTFLASHHLTAGSVVDTGGATVLHLVCKLGAENVFWVLKRAPAWSQSLCLARDSHGRNAFHYAAIRLIKTAQMSVYQNLVQPLVDSCAAAATARDTDGRTPLQIVAAMPVCSAMLRTQLGAAATAAPPSPPPHSWTDKIWAEMEYENRKFDQMDRDFSDVFSDGEEGDGFDAWSERIGAEHRRRHGPRQPSPPPKPASPAASRPPPSPPPQRLADDAAERARFEEEQERRRQADQKRRQQGEEARRRLCQTPPDGGTKKDVQLLRRYRSLQRLVHDDTGPLTVRDFAPLDRFSLRDVTTLVRLAGRGEGSPLQKKRVVRDLLRMWHPDKCMLNIGSRLRGDEKTVRSSVVSFVQHLSGML